MAEHVGTALAVGQTVVVERRDLDALLASLRSQGFLVMGPTVREGAIVYDELSSAADLPQGWTDEQDGGVYRLKRRNDEAVFGYAVGPQSWKRQLHPPMLRLWSAQRAGLDVEVSVEPDDLPKTAFLGVRACELHAIQIQDRVFLEGAFVDPSYRLRRERACIVAVNCGQPGGTCFCASMGTGPRVAAGFDLSLTEILDTGVHRFVVEVGTACGAAVMGAVPHAPAGEADLRMAERVVQGAAAQMGRAMDTRDIKALLYRNHDHRQWSNVAARCLACANCTMVCPTCFCTTVDDMTDLTGEHAERWRRWDSCFTLEFSFIHGGSVRASTPSRYRQWMTHKLASWIDQFGRSGCVGCGRCITWCPVGIDITQEVAAIRRSDRGTSGGQLPGAAGGSDADHRG